MTMSAEVTARILRTASELHSLAAEWRDLYERSRGGTPFQYPDWILAWVDAFQPQLISTVEVRREGVLIGLAPLLIYPRAEERVLAFMAGGVSDYLDVLADSQYENEVSGAVMDAICDLSDWTTFYFTDLSADSVIYRALPSSFMTLHDSCSALLLPPTKSELLQLFSKRQRANLRNARSRLARAGGGALEQASPADVPGWLQDLFLLHTNRWSRTGEPGVLAEEKVRAFHRIAAPRLVARGILRLYRLRVEDSTVAILYALAKSSTLFCYLQGYDPEFAYLSPGTQLMFSAMEDAIQHGIRKFDFLRGDEAYKRHWRARAETTFRVQLSRSGVLSIASKQRVAA